jgi:amino acid transporter
MFWSRPPALRWWSRRRWPKARHRWRMQWGWERHSLPGRLAAWPSSRRRTPHSSASPRQAASSLAWRGGDAPPLLARTLAHRKTPAAAILLVGVGTLVFLPLGGVGLVGSVASLLALVAFASVNAALLRLRFTRPDAERPFRVPLHVGRWPVLVVLGLLVVVLLVTQFEGRAYGITVAALVLGFLVQSVSWSREAKGEAG